MTAASFVPSFLIDTASKPLCADESPDLWFPDNGPGGERAKAVCRRCPLRNPCLQWAVDHDERDGIWGATTADDRKRLRRSTGAPDRMSPVRNHGTEAGYAAHRRRGDILPPHDPCGCRAGAHAASVDRRNRRGAA